MKEIKTTDVHDFLCDIRDENFERDEYNRIIAHTFRLMPDVYAENVNLAHMVAGKLLKNRCVNIRIFSKCNRDSDEYDEKFGCTIEYVSPLDENQSTSVTVKTAYKEEWPLTVWRCIAGCIETNIIPCANKYSKGVCNNANP